MVAVVLCEKKSQADTVAAGIGLSTSGPFYEGEYAGKHYRIVWARGHLFERAPPEEVVPNITWDNIETLSPLPKNPPLKLRGDVRKLFNGLKAAFDSADEVIIGTDPDREGEAIGRSIVEACRYRGPLFRLWLAGGADAASIRKAFANLRASALTESAYEAQQARDVADWQTQILTRATTIAGRLSLLGAPLAQGRGRAGVVSVGRVQTPTLKILVDRDLTIENFTPTTYWVPTLAIAQGAHQCTLHYVHAIAKTLVGEDVPGVTWHENESGALRPLFTDRAAVKAFEQRLNALAGTAVDVAAETKPTVKKPPLPFSLTSLQAEMNRKHRLTASQTLEAASELYLKGHLSYPRTERELLPAALWNDAPELMLAIATVPGMEPARSSLPLTRGVQSEKPRCYTEKDLEHHGLIPTTTLPDFDRLPGPQRKIWEAVTRRYIESHLPPAKGEKVTLTVRVRAEGMTREIPSTFETSGERITDPGWMAAFGAADKDTIPPVAGGPAKIVAGSAREEHTKPPPRFTEASLLEAMLNAGRYAEDKDAERLLKRVEGIGTPATRDKILGTLKDRAYVRVEKQKKAEYLISTDRGRALIQHVPALLKSVETTAQWETELGEIEELPRAQARERRLRFCDTTTAAFEQIIADLRTRIEALPAEQRQIAAKGPSVSPKMIEFARSIAARLKVEPPANLTTDFSVCKAFIEGHKEAFMKAPPAPGGGNRTPTPAMVNFAKKLAAEKGLQIPPGTLGSFDKTSTFIDETLARKTPGETAKSGTQSKANGTQRSGRPEESGTTAGVKAPTEAMVIQAERTAARLNVTLPPEARTNFQSCRSFLDQHLGPLQDKKQKNKGA